MSTNLNPMERLSNIAAQMEAEKAANEAKVIPAVSLEGFTFTLAKFEFAPKWVDTVDKATGEVKKEKVKGEFIVSDDGTCVKSILSLIVTDKEGHSTSASNPFRKYLDVPIDDAAALNAHVGKVIELVNPRIVFREMGKKDDKYGGMVSKLDFTFDGYKL